MSTPKLLRELRTDLDDGGLRGAFLVRDLDSGEELGIEPDLVHAAASLVKIPLAIAVQDRIRRGELDGADEVLVPPDRFAGPGPAGLSKFRHPVRISLDDLLYLSTCLSDNLAADTLFALVPPAAVAKSLSDMDIRGIAVRHTLRDLTETPAEQFGADDVHLAHELAIGAGTAGRGHRIAQLDVTRANSGSARAFVDLLQALWRPSAVPAEVAERLRELLGNNVLRQRLAPDFSSDSSRWSSKTGTLLNLRHEVGVVEHADGGTFAIAALTESRVAATVQPGAEALMSHVARSLRDHLRSSHHRR